jgi:hypothetical protein
LCTEEDKLGRRRGDVDASDGLRFLFCFVVAVASVCFSLMAAPFSPIGSVRGNTDGGCGQARARPAGAQA